MKKTHSSKKQAWYLSLISLVLCVSMLAGTTFAWFTDNVTSGINTIAAGVLDVELYHTNAAVTDQQVDETTKLFLDVNGEAILWEPGVVSWENLRVTNAGDLALNWKLSLNTANENFVIDPETGIYYGLSKALKVGIVPGGITATDRAAVVASVAETDWTTLSAFLADGQLLPASEGTYEETFGIVIWWEPGDNDNWWNLNNGKQLSSGEVLSIDLGINLVASQMVYENDAFDNDYDEEASYTYSGSYSHNTSVSTDAEGKVTADAVMGTDADMVSAQVAAGTKLEAGTTDMTLTVNAMESSGANITAGAGESISSVDVHVSGLAADNTVPVKVTVKHLLPKYMNAGNYTLYHVENGTPVLMTLVSNPVAHNEYSYDPYTGDVTMTLANFCEISSVVKDKRVWEGKVAQQFSGGNGKAETPFLIASADQLALMSKLVSGNADAKAEFNYSTAVPNTTAFADAHYKLVADIYFPGQTVTEATDDDSLIFYPVGFWYYTEKDESGKPIYKHGADFTGVFDGQGHTISGIYQNTWQMNGYYNDGYSGKPYYWKAAMGLFGAVFNAEIRNLTISDFQSDGEFTPTGCVAAYAGGNTVFENITLEGCNPRVYNTGNGGIVGLNYNDTEGAVDKLIFRNITVDQTNKISALWGSYDVSCGGILGRLRDNSLHGNGVYNTATFENCHVAAEMDVNNDCCANYQYYQYRYSGVFIGTVDYVDTIGVEAVEKQIVHATNCYYYIGEWSQYWYCELVVNSLASYTHDYQYSRLTPIKDVSEIKDGETWIKEGNFVIPINSATDEATCYHIVKDANGNLVEHKHTDAGYETVNGQEVLVEDGQHYYLPFSQLYTGYGWGSTPVFNHHGITVENQYTGSDVKFEAQDDLTIQNGQVILETGKVYKVGDFFKAVNGVNIQQESVQVLLSSPNGALTLNYSPDKENWANGTFTVSGSGYGTLRINDYSYCKNTSLSVAVNPAEAEHTSHCSCGGTGIGNTHEVLQGWTPWDGESDITAAGNYYLTKDITGGTQRWVGLRHDETGANETFVINLCLNGHNIASNNRVFGIGQGATVNLMNCQHSVANGESLLTGYGTTDDVQHTTMVQAGLIFTQVDSILNIYDGITMQLLEKKDKEGNVMYPETGGIISTSERSVITMYGGTLKDGRAQKNGGAVHVSKGSFFYMKGGEILDSLAMENGGSVYVSDGSVFEMTGGTISGGQAQQHGGNVFVYTSGAATISGGTISGGQAPHGGNIYADTNAKQLTVNGGEITGGVANENGGNIYLYYSKNNEISGGTISDGKALRGGNIFTTNVTLLVSGNAMITGGIASNATDVSHGGNIGLAGSSVLKMTGGTITGGKVDGVDDKNELGGNIYVSQYAKVDISGGTISNGFAADLGGNIYFAYLNQGNVISGGTITGGTARSGGNLYADNTSTVTLSGGTISGGIADDHGGNLCIGQDAIVTVSGATLQNGSAGIGGNVYMSGRAKLDITGGLITGGHARGGGNISIEGAGTTLTMSGGIIEKGVSTGNHGGNIYIHTGASASFTGGTVKNGEVYYDTNGTAGDYKDKNGGNLSISGNSTTVVIAGTAVFEGGYSANRAGNIFFHSGTLTIGGTAKITNGTAATGGQCVHVNSTVQSDANNGKLILTGAPTVTDLYLEDPINVEKLTGGSIGVSNGWMTQAIATTDASGYAKYFKINNPQYYAIQEKNNELWFAGHATHCVCADTYTGKESACSHTDISGKWIAWDGKSNISEGGNYYLTQDLTGSTQYWMGGTYQNTTPMTINLCLNGHSIDSVYRVFGVAPYVTFNLMNCSATESVLSGCCSTGDNGRVIHLHSSTSVMNMYGNITLRGKEMPGRVVPNGGAVNCIGTFNMYGGTIYGASVGGGYTLTKDNVTTEYYAQGCGGAIVVSGTFNLYAGTIYGGNGNVLNHITTNLNGANVNISASRGGAVYLNEGAKVNMYGGTVYGSKMGDGGAFWLGHSTSVLNITGGTIYAGYATYGGGAIKMQGGATLNISNALIDGTNDLGMSYNAGAAGGGALCLHGGTAKLTNVTIQNCVAGSGKGGAINIWSDNASARLVLSGNVQITNNTHIVSGVTATDNVYLSKGKTLALDGLNGSSLVGITMEEAGTILQCTSDVTANFFSDAAGYEVGYTNPYLSLRTVTNPEDVVE